MAPKGQNNNTWRAAWSRIPRKSKVMFFLAFLLFTLPQWSRLYTGQSGQFIVATEKMAADQNFRESVVYILSHGFKGAAGLVLNRRLNDDQASHIPNYLKGRHLNLFWGGPVMFPDKISVLMRDPKTGRVIHDDLEDLINKQADYLVQAEGQSDLNNPNSFPRFYVGAAVWGPLQLERERRSGDWLSGSPVWGPIFDQPEREIWAKIYAKFRDASRIGSRRSM